MGASPGAFFSYVEIEAAFEAGRFVGWRLADLPGQRPRWLDLRRGDVVTAINGLGVERPDDALRIWETLQVASEVHIEYRRQGEARSLRIPVHDEGSPDTQSAPSPAGQSKN
jgi:type II secretory pathway component PulC